MTKSSLDSNSVCVPASIYRFHPAAEAELKEASDWYEDHREGLGLDFLAAVRHKIFDILENPGPVESAAGSSVRYSRRTSKWILECCVG